MEERPEATRPKPRRARRTLGVGCLVVLVLLCGGLTALGVALKDGPVTLGLPGNNALKLGSDDFVLSNSSFQDGTTYYADLKGDAVRNIIELHVLPDKRTMEIVLHHASKDEQSENHLFDVPMP
jgi:hypothetical protein